MVVTYTRLTMMKRMTVAMKVQPRIPMMTIRTTAGMKARLLIPTIGKPTMGARKKMNTTPRSNQLTEKGDR
jgi:hypothetical protein